MGLIGDKNSFKINGLNINIIKRGLTVRMSGLVQIYSSLYYEMVKKKD